MTRIEDSPTAHEIVTDLLDATAKTILEMHKDISELGFVFVPVADAILFLEQHEIDPPRSAYQLLLQLITSGAATSSADEE